MSQIKKFFLKIISSIPSVSNSLAPDKPQHFVKHNLGPNCLQSYQQMTKVSTSSERVQEYDTLCKAKKKRVVWTGNTLKKIKVGIFFLNFFSWNIQSCLEMY